MVEMYHYCHRLILKMENNMIRKIKPQAYLDEFYPDSKICTKTVINWIKIGKIQGEQTLTGRWLVVINGTEPSKINLLVQMMESSGV